MELSDVDLRTDGPVTRESWLGATALSYPRRPRTILGVLARAVQLWPDAVAFVDEDGATATYAEFASLVQGGVADLRGRGLRPGDRVAVAGRNRLDLAVAVFACAAARVIMVGLNTRLAASEWAYMLRRGDVRLALGQHDLLDPLQAAAKEAGLDSDRVHTLELPQPLPVEPVEEPAEDETYQVVWTSGSTGRPKGSQVLHRCSVHSGMSYQRILQLTPGETTAVLFPLYYISAMHAHVLPAMLGGATCVLVAGTDQGRWLDLLAAHQVAWAYAVPSWWSLALRDKRLTGDHLPALRLVAAGGAPFPAELVAALRERFPAAQLLDVYGLSETHSPATILLDHEFATHAGSTGRALPCMEIEIRDNDGNPVPPGTPGEIALRGSLVTTGYLDDPEATGESIVDGWFSSGDVGRLDEDGYLYLLDRKKDMINRGGHKVFSAEVERVIRQLPGVADVAVVATPDRTAGEAVAAVVVAGDGASLSPLEVKQWVRTRLADYATPGEVRFVRELPRNAVGKTDKPTIREWLSAGTG
ncbi:MAG: AMP-binding protein [Actinocatenispora sp.]